MNGDMFDETRDYPSEMPTPDGRMVRVLPQAWEIEAILREIDAENSKEGWDLPARIYAVLGDPGNYRHEIITTVSGYPVAWMQTALLGDYLRGIPASPGLPPEVKGLILSMEMWKHPILEELEAVYPEVYARFVASAKALGIDPDAEEGGEEFKRIVNSALDRAADTCSPSESQFKIEMRTSVVLMRDDTSLQVTRIRGIEDPKPAAVGDGTMVLRGMRAMLTGCWPADLEVEG